MVECFGRHLVDRKIIPSEKGEEGNGERNKRGKGKGKGENRIICIFIVTDVIIEFIVIVRVM